jgi:hypothetical protein
MPEARQGVCQPLLKLEVFQRNPRTESNQHDIGLLDLRYETS